MVKRLCRPFERVALEGHTDNVTSCVWNPDGTRLATASSVVTKTVGGRGAHTTDNIFSSLTSMYHVPEHTHCMGTVRILTRTVRTERGAGRETGASFSTRKPLFLGGLSLVVSLAYLTDT